MISTDKSILDKESKSLDRMKDYSARIESLDIVVFSLKKHYLPLKNNLGNINIYNTNSYNKFFYIFDAIKISLKIKVDLITAQDPFETGLVATVLSLIKKTKLQLQVHTDFLSPYFKTDGVLNRIRVLISKLTIPRADGIRVVSNRIKRSLIKYGVKENKITVLPIYTDINSLQERDVKVNLKEKYPQFDFIILLASRLESEKNIDLALNVFQKALNKTEKNIGLVIAGSGSLENSLKNMVSKLKLNNNVIFEGFVEDISSYYKTCDIFLSTSNYEGFGLSLLEAFVCGANVLTTDVGLVGDVLDSSNVMICGVKDKRCLENKLTDFIKSKKDFSKEYRSGFLAETKEEYLDRYIDAWKQLIS